MVHTQHSFKPGSHPHIYLWQCNCYDVGLNNRKGGVGFNPRRSVGWLIEWLIHG